MKSTTEQHSDTAAASERVREHRDAEPDHHDRQQLDRAPVHYAAFRPTATITRHGAYFSA